jgi:hypothetical protein
LFLTSEVCVPVPLKSSWRAAPARPAPELGTPALPILLLKTVPEKLPPAVLLAMLMPWPCAVPTVPAAFVCCTLLQEMS